MTDSPKAINRRLALVPHRSDHHASHSGYSLLADHLPGTVVRGNERLVVPWRIRRMLGRLTTRGTDSLYDTNSVAKEIDALVAMLQQRDGLIHFFHGARDLSHSTKWAHFLKWRIVATVHKPFSLLRQLLEEGGALNKIDGVICLASSEQANLRNALGHERVWVVPHGIDTQFFTPAEGREEATNSSHLVFVGQHLRDFDLLDKVLVALRGRFKELALTAVVSKPYQRLLPRREYVRCLSSIRDEELRDVYRSATCLLLPLRDSTACNSILEALACGIPVVTTAAGGTRDYVDEDSGYLCRPGSENKGAVDDMVDAIDELLRNSQLNVKMGLAARRQALEFSWPKVGDRMLKVYKEKLDFDAYDMD